MLVHHVGGAATAIAMTTVYDLVGIAAIILVATVQLTFGLQPPYELYVFGLFVLSIFVSHAGYRMGADKTREVFEPVYLGWHTI